MDAFTAVLALAFLTTLGLLIRSLFRQAGIQDAIRETSQQAEGQLKLWEDFADHLDEGVALIDDREAVRYCNQAFAAMVGWTGRAAFHQPLDTVLTMTDPDGSAPKHPLSERKQHRQVVPREGIPTPVYAVRRPIRKPAGYSVLILQDASSELAEKELRHRLVNLSSFELRAPITAMKGYADMLLEGDAGNLSPQARDYLAKILDSSNKLLGIVDDMASVEALSSNKVASKLQTTDVMTFLRGIKDRLAKTAAEAGRKLTFPASHLKVAADIDATQFARLLTMLTNTAARTAAVGGTVVLRVEETPGTVDIHLENQGEPVPRETQSNLFDYIGAQGFEEGIGFYVAKQIIEAHQASVGVTPRKDGNDFLIRLPKRASEAAAEGATAEAKAAAATARRELAEAGLTGGRKHVAADIRKK